MKLNSILLLLVLSFVACRDKPTNASFSVKNELPSDFDIFFDRFQNDSIFQLSHIMFPLEGHQDTFPNKWNEDNWILHRPFNPQDQSFNSQFINLKNIIIEKTKDKNGFFSMERRFSKLNNQWFLIYYAVDTNGL